MQKEGRRITNEVKTN